MGTPTEESECENYPNPYKIAIRFVSSLQSAWRGDAVGYPALAVLHESNWEQRCRNNRSKEEEIPACLPRLAWQPCTGRLNPFACLLPSLGIFMARTNTAPSAATTLELRYKTFPSNCQGFLHSFRHRKTEVCVISRPCLWEKNRIPLFSASAYPP